MRGVQAACPACGGPVHFKISSALVAVCDYCHSVVGRKDRKLEDLGKVSALVETSSPLQLGLKGTYQGKSFELVGRVQYQHAAGGIWDEWYAAFSNGRWGWLAEAQGRFYLSFAKTLPETVDLPRLEELAPGQSVRIADETLTVGEVGQATAAGAEGEMPFVLHPGESHYYADLSGPEQRFVTLDYEHERPEIFIGREATLDALGISPDAISSRAPRQISGAQVNCPNCGGPLSLTAPDQTLRVICPSCHAKLDCNQGNLKYPETLNVGNVRFSIPLGAVGTLDGVEYTLIGAMQRSVTYEGQDYYWSEYLLYAPRIGFRWLVESDRNWSFVEPISPGDVQEGSRTAIVKGRDFALFQQATATVRYVIGEFYWKVEIGENVYTRDFISPPQMVSVEHSVVLKSGGAARKRKAKALAALAASQDEGRAETGLSATAAEVNCSLATYLPHAALEEAFKLDRLPRGWKVAPNQPRPVDRRIFVWWIGFLVALSFFFVFGNLIGPGADGCLGIWAAIFVSIIPIGGLIYRHSFEVSRWKESDYSPYAGSDDDDDD